MSLPEIIQGGMGVGVSNWRLARAVSQSGQLGVVSGTALDAVLARRLQLGDVGGHIRHALDQFPFPDVARRVLDRYFVPGGKAADRPFRATPVPAVRPSRELLELLVVANFAEVYLAKDQHDGPVGINLLEKIQLPTLPSIFGAMLAGVNCILMGAGVPRAIPGVLDRLGRGEPVELPVDVRPAARRRKVLTRFDPTAFAGAPVPPMVRPDFLPIVSSAPLAAVLARKASGRVEGFVVEGSTAGGHNAPPRGALRLNERGEPCYGPRDAADLAAMRELELPFWLAGSYGRATGLRDARALGAVGIQVGTAFAFCEESGIDGELKARVLARIRAHPPAVRTDALTSPTGFPFKVVQLTGTLSDPGQREARRRVCDLGYLRQAWLDDGGHIRWRCPAEPVEEYIRKGGDPEDTIGRCCVCNGLLATIGLGQLRGGGRRETGLLTAGDDLEGIGAFLAPGRESYSAREVVRTLLSGAPAA